MQPEYVHVAITTTDGRVSIMMFVTKEFSANGETNWTREASEANVNAEIAKANISASSWRIIELSEIPSDRTFRNSWVDDGGITHDMTVAKEELKSMLRQKRKPLLEALDVDYMRALESNDTANQATVIAAKQYLRDITEHQDVNSASTVEELKQCLELL